MTFRTISHDTRILVASGNVLLETTFGEFTTGEYGLDNDEISCLRQTLQRGLSYDGGGGGMPRFTVMPRR